MSTSYRPEIDGLRAIAVCAVVLFHADFHYASGGYVGVDIFFVISGYLIATILIFDLRNDRFSLKRFYERRIRRIAPALLLVTVLTLILAPFFLILEETIEVYESAVATALFLANVRFWQKTGYFETAAEERPLLHMWSLAVEEQFYIVFPLLLLALWRWRHQWLMGVFIICALASLVVAEIGWRTAPTANFFLPFSRAWELLIGVLAALRLQDRPPGTNTFDSVLSLLGLGMILGSIIAFDRFVPTPSVWLLIPVMGTYLVICHAGPGTAGARMLSLPVMVGLGLISYSMYLFHQPILAYARVALPVEARPEWLMIVLGFLSIPLGYLSWRFIEQPARKTMSTRSVVTLSCGGFAAVVALGLGVHFHKPLVEKIYLASLGTDGAENYQVLQRAGDTQVHLEGNCRLRGNYMNADFEKAFDACLARHGPAVIVLGGSHAGDLHGVLGTASNHPFLISLTQGFCRPHRRLAGPPPHPCHYEGVRDFVERRGQDVALIVYTQPFFTLFEAYRAARTPDGFHPELATETMAYLASLQDHTPVVMLGPRRTPGFDVSRLNPRKDMNAQIARLYAPGVGQIEDLADQVFQQEADAHQVPYLSLIKLLGRQMPQDVLMDGELIFHDTNHLSAHGERVTGRLLAAALAQDNSAAAQILKASILAD